MEILDEIKDKLDIKVLNPIAGSEGGGCINRGRGYIDDNGMCYFMKECRHENHRGILGGEAESLRSLFETETVNTFKSLGTFVEPMKESYSLLVLPYIQMKGSLNEASQKQFGQDVSKLHHHNEEENKKSVKATEYLGKSRNNDPSSYVNQFGFDSTTCCGSIELNNDWVEDWVSFYARNRLDVQFRMAEEQYGRRDIITLWSHFQQKIPNFFSDFKDTHNDVHIPISLLHGDLWGGNVSQIDAVATEASGDEADSPDPKTYVCFDPASFYGHSEFDLSITSMFGGFNRAFYNAYHDKSPKTRKYDDRQKLYQLFHVLNHWNMFGGHYEDETVSLLKTLNNMGTNRVL